MIADADPAYEILRNEKEVLKRSKNFLDNYPEQNVKIYKEYRFLHNKYRELMEEVKYLLKISDTYQFDLINTRERLKEEIEKKKRTEKKLKSKINELEKTKQKLEKTNKKLTKISSRDQLTGLYNRREFEKIIKREWRSAVREAHPISLIMIDIDYFKKFNDNYGHLAGDNCLQQISKAMQKTLKRPRDFLGRYGGEEFVCILPNTNKDGALHMAETLRNEVIELKIPHNYSPGKEHVTISLGVATTEEPELFVFEEIIDQADQALYQAKNSGRNKSCFSRL